MKRLTEKELDKVREEKGYSGFDSLCPFCSKLLVSVPYVWDELEKDYVCKKCFEKKNGIGRK